MQLHSALLKPASAVMRNSFGPHALAVHMHLRKHQVAEAGVAQDGEPSARELRLVQHQNLIIARLS
jgi:hypothetical protein